MRVTGILSSATHLFLCITIIYLLGFFAHAFFLGKTVYGDGIYYYSWLHTISIDRDINFTNEYQQLNGDQPKTIFGTYGNKYTIGPMLLWLPNYLLIHRILRGDGYEFPYQLTVGVTGVLYALTGLLLLYRLLLFQFTPRVSGLVILGLAGATNLLFYGSIDTVNSHALSFFAVSLFLLLLFQKKQNWIAVGTALGLLTLIRPQDCIVGFLIIPFLKKQTGVTSLLSTACGVVPFLSIQWYVWRMLYGTWIISPYFLGNEGFTFLQPHLFSVLFSPSFGLILYMPLVLMGFAGFYFDWKQIADKKYWFLAILLGQIYLISTWSTWWQGGTYSIRMFVGMLPFFGIPLAICFARLQTLFKHLLPIPILFLTSLSFLNLIMIIWMLIRN